LGWGVAVGNKDWCFSFLLEIAAGLLILNFFLTLNFFVSGVPLMYRKKVQTTNKATAAL